MNVRITVGLRAQALNGLLRPEFLFLLYYYVSYNVFFPHPIPAEFLPFLNQRISGTVLLIFEV